MNIWFPNNLENEMIPITYFSVSDSKQYVLLNSIKKRTYLFADYLSGLKFLEQDIDDMMYLSDSFASQIFCIFTNWSNELDSLICSKKTIKYTFDDLMKNDELLLCLFDVFSDFQLFQIQQSFLSIWKSKKLSSDIRLLTFINKILSLCEYLLDKRKYDKQQKNFIVSFDETKRANMRTFIFAIISFIASCLSIILTYTNRGVK